jgi:L-asparaginase
MMDNPDMVAGPGRFDTRLMEIGNGRVVSKGGAEGFLGMGLMPGAVGPASPAMGVAIKISDGDSRGKICAGVALEVLRQLGVFSPLDFEELSDFGPRFPVLNWRKIDVGEAFPTFELEMEV